MTEPNDRGAAAMNRTRLLQLIEAYGADPARWPESERGAALTLLARDPEAQRVQREAAELDAMLDGEVALEPSAALRRAVAEIPLRAAPASVPVAIPGLPWLLASFRRAAFAAAAVLALGVLAGVSTSAMDDEPLAGTAVSADQGDRLAAQGDEDGDDSLDTLVALAFNDVLDEEALP